MELNTFCPEDINTKFKATLALQRTGTQTFNKKAVDLIQLEVGSIIGFHQNAKNPKEWFITHMTESGFLMCKNGNRKGLIWRNVEMARKIMKSLEITEDSTVLEIDEEPMIINQVPYYRIVDNPISKK